MDLIKRAETFAFDKHAGQVRKYTGLPYISHPAAVAKLLATVTSSEATIAAGWLHDVVEDTRATHEEIYELFGPAVGLLVFYATKKTTAADGNRSQRLAIELRHVAEAPAAAQTVKLADIIDNTKNIVELDPGFAGHYLEEKSLFLDALEQGHPTLRRHLRNQLAHAFVDLRAKRMRP